jgi:amidase
MAKALAAGEVSAVELAQAAIGRIEALDGPINAVVARDFEGGLEAARAADAALARGERAPLLGVPMTIKDSHQTARMPTTWGLEAFAGWRAPADSLGVQRLKAAGAVILGKTNIPPHLGDWQSNNPIYGRTNNPHDLGRSPGGSSGGAAAAVAAGMIPLEFGSDIGGSIRIPAHFCGVFGHKPSWALVPLAGHAPPGVVGPATEFEFGVVGPLARSAADLDLALSVLAGPTGPEANMLRLDLPPPRAERLGDFRVLVLDQHPMAAADAEVLVVLNAVADRAANAGAKVERASAKVPDLAGAHEQYAIMLNVLMNLTPDEAAGPAPMSAQAWMMALNRRESVRYQWAALFEDFDVVLAPPFGVAAFPHDDRPPVMRTLTVDGAQVPYFSQLAWPGIATYPGLPATCAPAGRTREDLPVGVQIIGGYGQDRTTIAFAGLVGAV